ncbi:MAG TPA: tRNA lysidine(34) synthetase TilS [Thermoanaerobaculaceae bacterium]|nr:tRNA lysidine(34) synthetase TilS [Thermoanaerobaculaceae bacterium]
MTRMDSSTFLAAFRQHFPDLVGRPILVAVSGGADSVALLCLVHGAAEALGCRAFAAHVHHHARGADADADAASCAELCAGLGVPFAVEHLAPGRPRGASREAWWRGERYRVLEEARRRLDCAAVATAHTRDDQAETVLLKLLRGAGPRGVAGIRRRAGSVIRPLLDVTRAELRAYLVGRDTPWREDATNADPAAPRAWVRSELLPRLEARFPGSTAHLGAFASALAGDEELLGGLLREQAEWPEVGRAVPLVALVGLAQPLRRRWMLELAARLPLAEPPSRRQLEAVEAMLAGRDPAAVDLGRRWVLRREAGAVRLCPPPLAPFPPRAAGVPSVVALPGGFVGRIAAPGGDDAPHRAILAARAVSAPLAWRSVLPGERFGAARRPVKRLLAGAGIPVEWRSAWPVLLAGDTMVWLPAVGVVQGWEGGPAEGVVAELEEPWRRHMR